MNFISTSLVAYKQQNSISQIPATYTQTLGK